MSLENIQGKMSRKEMKSIIAGGSGLGGTNGCQVSPSFCGSSSNNTCTKPDGSSGKCGVRGGETQCRCL